MFALWIHFNAQCAGAESPTVFSVLLIDQSGLPTRTELCVVASVQNDQFSFEQAAVGYFCQKITSRSGSQNDRLSAIKEVLKKYFGDGEGVDLFNSLLAIEIDKKVGIKKYSNLVYEKSEELYENTFEDDEEIGDF